MDAAREILDSDYFRRSPSRLGGRSGHKEWQHFLVHAGPLELLVNFNLLDDPWDGGAETARLIVMAQDDGWDGDVDRFAASELSVAPTGLDAHFGANRLEFREGCYHLAFSLRQRPIAAELTLVPQAPPGKIRNVSLAPGRTIAWTFVPRLEASGVVQVGGRTHTLDRALAYHDHNWGHFAWGDDFSWEWGSLLPEDPGIPWSAMFVRSSDRGRLSTRCQLLHLAGAGRRGRTFLDDAVTVRPRGLLRPEGVLKIPRVMALAAPGTACDVPRELEVSAHREDDAVEFQFRPDAVSQIVIPNETDVDQVTTICETSGRVSLDGVVDGERVRMEGRGVVEFVRN